MADAWGYRDAPDGPRRAVGIRSNIADVSPETDTLFSLQERERLGWHTQYDHYDENSRFTWMSQDLIQWDGALFWKEHGLNVLTDLIRRSLK